MFSVYKYGYCNLMNTINVQSKEESLILSFQTNELCVKKVNTILMVQDKKIMKIRLDRIVWQ